MLQNNKKSLSLSLSLLIMFSFNTYALPKPSHIVVAPQCLVKSAGKMDKTLFANASFALIETDDAGIQKLIEAKMQHRITPCGGFVDVTERWHAFQPKTLANDKRAQQFLIDYTAPTQSTAGLTKTSYEIKYEKQVNALLTQLNPQMMWDNLSALSSFQDRYANSDHGVKAANWIKDYVETLAKNNQRSDVTVYTISTGSYKQPSVVAKIGTSSAPGIVIGAHMDTLSGSFSKKPGADDDGSGTVTVLEVARTLLSSGMTFNKPIYFMWYAAEEQGLVGSGYVVSEFKKKNIPVDAVIHFDLTGYAYRNESTLWLIKDYTNKELTSYLEKLINTYVKQPVKYTACGYACSDHASWTKGGFIAAMPAEAAFENSNPSIHSSQDTLEKLTLSHMTDYAKLGTAFVVELAQPVMS
jgi:bacterial leucyl aminopeptidase